jgi:hypothetical protein
MSHPGSPGVSSQHAHGSGPVVVVLSSPVVLLAFSPLDEDPEVLGSSESVDDELITGASVVDVLDGDIADPLDESPSEDSEELAPCVVESGCHCGPPRFHGSPVSLLAPVSSSVVVIASGDPKLQAATNTSAMMVRGVCIHGS